MINVIELNVISLDIDHTSLTISDTYNLLAFHIYSIQWRSSFQFFLSQIILANYRKKNPFYTPTMSKKKFLNFFSYFILTEKPIIN